MSAMAKNTRNAVIALMGKNRLVRARELEGARIDRSELRRLTSAGVLERVTRGVYRLADAPATETHTVATVLKRVPQATVCLLTALQMHGLTTQLPHQVWIALDEKARRPRLTDLPVRVMRFSGAALTAGVESRKVEGVTIRVYGPAKTVADCFKYRNKIGLDIAIEALRDYRRQYPKRGEELREYVWDRLESRAGRETFVELFGSPPAPTRLAVPVLALTDANGPTQPGATNAAETGPGGPPNERGSQGNVVAFARLRRR